jgi:hypothetical protein
LPTLRTQEFLGQTCLCPQRPIHPRIAPAAAESPVKLGDVLQRDRIRIRLCGAMFFAIPAGWYGEYTRILCCQTYLEHYLMGHE